MKMEPESIFKELQERTEHIRKLQQELKTTNRRVAKRI